MQWCILAESLRNSVHSKGAHGYGGIWGGEPATFHHNLLAFHDSRNPRFCGSRYTNSPATEKVNFTNNVIYNWGSNSGYAGEGGYYNMMNNYYRSGKATKTSNGVYYRIFSPNADDGSNTQPKGVWGHFHLSGNIMINTPSVTENNWLGFQPSGTYSDSIKSEVPFEFPPYLRLQRADSAYLSVTSFAGASLKRDAVDTRIVNNVLNGTVTVTSGSNGSTGGFIDSQADVGGWPEYTYDPASVPSDTDADGMPDDWETSKGLNPNDATDGSTKTLDGQYTNVEVYLNELAAPVVNRQYLESNTAVNEIQANSSLRIYPNPFKSGNLNIKTDEKINKVGFYLLTGTKIYEKEIVGTEVSFTMPQLNVGIYLVKVKMENGKVLPTLLIVE